MVMFNGHEGYGFMRIGLVLEPASVAVSGCTVHVQEFVALTTPFTNQALALHTRI